MIVDDDRRRPSTSHVAQDAEVVEGQHRHLGVGDRLGDATRASAVGGRVIAHHVPRRVGAGDAPASRRASGSAPRCAGRRGPCGPATAGQRRRVGPLDAADREHLLEHARRPRRRRSPGRRRRPPRRRAASTSWVREQLGVAAARPRPAPATQPAARLVGALGEGEEPAAGVVAVVGQLLDALGGDRGEHGSRLATQPLEAARAARSRTAAAARSSRAKSPLSSSTSRTLRNSPASRKNASASSGGTGEPSGSAGHDATGRPRRRGRAAAGPGRAGRARCWPARCPPRGRARGCTTRRAGGRRRARRRRASGSTPRGRRGRRRRGWSCRRRRAGPRSRCRRPSARRRCRAARRRCCRGRRSGPARGAMARARSGVGHRLSHHMWGTLSGMA